MMSQKRRKLQWSLVTSLFTLHYICTYRLVFSSAFHPYQSLSMSSPYTDSLPFPSCLLRISQTGFKKDFHKCPLLQILHSPLYGLRAISINSKGHWRRLKDMEGLSCVHGRVFNNYLQINNRRFDNECVKSQSQTKSGVEKLDAFIRLWSLRCLYRVND